MSDRFTEIVDLYYAGLYRFAYGLVGNAADACDLTQQTYYLYAAKRASIRDEDRVKSWLFTTLYREFLKTVRHGRRQEPLGEEHEAESDWQVEDLAELRRLDAQTVLDCLSRLEETHRGPLTLFYLESLSYADIAETLGVPIGTVMSRIARGKQQLRRLLMSRDTGGAQVLPFSTMERKAGS